MKMLEMVKAWCEEGNGKAPGGDSRYMAALAGVKKAILWISEIEK